MLPEDLQLAKIPDSQGLGGASHFEESEPSHKEDHVAESS